MLDPAGLGWGLLGLQGPSVLILSMGLATSLLQEVKGHVCGAWPEEGALRWLQRQVGL